MAITSTKGGSNFLGDLMLNRAEFFPNPVKVSVEHSEEVDVLVVTEERIYIVGLSQNVPAPPIQHSELQKRC
jgi:hypothetical protein